jgi:FkbM family methyltransferase
MNKFKFIIKSFGGLELFKFLVLLLTNKLYWILNKDLIFDDSHLYSFHYRFQNSVNKIYLRRQDVATFFEVFYFEIYNTNTINIKDINIVDLGAHIGFTSLYFRLLYPNSRILAVEPSETNAFIFKKNNPNIDILSFAIANNDGESYLNTNTKSQNFSLDNQGEITKTIKFTTLLSKYLIDHIAILKVDIEGAETLLLESIMEWSAKVNFLIMECHNNEEIVIPLLKKSNITYKIV